MTLVLNDTEDDFSEICLRYTVQISQKVLFLNKCFNHGAVPPPLTPMGKTLLAKAVANQTSATFLRIVGSELIQKYLGDGPKLVRELFRVAEVAGFRNMSLLGVFLSVFWAFSFFLHIY